METQNLEVNTMSKVSEINKTDASNQIRTAADIQAWTISYLGELLEVDPEEVDITIPFDRYGLDSSAAIGLTGDLGDWLGYDVDPTLLYDYPTIEGLVKHLSADWN
ncbi:acyl carrier protein [Nostoc sp. 'Peltigera membranacea cyanobiont' 232]|uniref:acyl carrier protein n=1 Tax=Nostoc sp. 'Peltigera membranacea cyanobiont' 232 TaxID=2014531 RepID=UPI000B954CC5|nr:acyl carrier protein [Nostoc sp. 'Peltigera membranacea cyanobiont' 232]OYE01613.1 phosphopantetheine-binding protein [Nostoc sp. 'Peltigera membranacea cyanobiont' 232]